MIKQSGVFKIFNEMTWPFPCGGLSDIAWRLRYGHPNKKDLLVAASVINAYQSLIGRSQKRRNEICQKLKAKPDFVYGQEQATAQAEGGTTDE